MSYELNTDSVKKELKALYDSSLDDVIPKLQDKISRLQELKDDKRDLEMRVKIEIWDDDDLDIDGDYNDFYKPHIFLQNKSVLKASEEIRAINETPLSKQDLPVLSDKIEITKNDASAIIERLCALVGYQFMTHRTSDMGINTLIDMLADKVVPNNE